ncbi:hypothetical protein [Micromonospora mirobrigensis]|uniref:Uncharacterized protein n=1 Tax=Micromonospora mirobrigensis TaxID=262898 RepID=A0A1C4W7J4_9ACTN|nr:hypothetical protein [Micromonospora mirobrigensis]SCE92180.1 hypothetical protein GA0070564_10261 [Micromonospora mirobrigensis]
MPPQSTEFAPTILLAYRKGTELVEDALRKIRDSWNELVGKVNGLLAKVEEELNNDSIWATISEWWTEKIANAVRAVHEKMEIIQKSVSTVLERVEKAVQGSVPIGSLFETGFRYTTGVLTPLSEIGNDMGGGHNLAYWQGPTKEVYTQEVEKQTSAVDASVGKVKATSEWLADVATANTAYIAELGERGASVAGSILATAIDVGAIGAGAVTQAPLALQDLAGTIGTATTETLAYAVNLGKRLAEVLQSINTLANEIADHSGELSGGRWPQSVTG